MRLTKMLAATLLAGLAAGQAYAGSPSAVAGHPSAEASGEASPQASAQAVYEGVNADGSRIRLTLADSAPAVLVRIDRGAALASPHWTSLIGTGTAASIER